MAEQTATHKKTSASKAKNNSTFSSLLRGTLSSNETKPTARQLIEASTKNLTAAGRDLIPVGHLTDAVWRREQARKKPSNRAPPSTRLGKGFGVPGWGGKRKTSKKSRSNRRKTSKKYWFF